MENNQNFEPAVDQNQAGRPQKDLDSASVLTGQVLRAMGWKEFDDLLNTIEGVNKGKQIHILSTGFCP